MTTTREKPIKENRGSPCPSLWPRGPTKDGVGEATMEAADTEAISGDPAAPIEGPTRGGRAAGAARPETKADRRIVPSVKLISLLINHQYLSVPNYSIFSYSYQVPE